MRPKRFRPFILMIAVLAMTAASTAAQAYDRYNRVTEYDAYFSKYAKRFFGPGFDWRYFKAQAVAESGLKPDVQSQVGAVGLMQIMPRTFDEIRRKNSYIKGSRAEPRWNVAAGIYYDKNLYKTWKAERPFRDKMAFTFGSFNAGKGNILKAQKKAEKQGLNPNLWESIRRALPRVTGDRSEETLHYVDKIFHIKEVLE